MFDESKGAWEILPAWRAALNDRRYELLDRPEIEAFLRRFLSDYRVMSNMRQILTATDPVSRFTDDQLVELLETGHQRTGDQPGRK